MLLLAATILVAPGVASSPAAVGLLIGIAHEAASSFDGYAAAPQSLEWCWVELTPGQSPKPSCRRGLVVPRGGEFVRYVMQRTVERNEESGQESWRDGLVPWAWGALEPPSAKWTPPKEGESVPCSWSELRLLFASPQLLSFREQGGNSEECEPRGWRRSSRGWVQTHQSDDRVVISEVAGRGARKAYARAAAQAYRRWQKEGHLEADSADFCQPNEEDETSWVIVRDRTKWTPVFDRQEGLSFCQMGAVIEWPLPAAVVGFAEPRLPWAEVLARHPGATSAHSSPDRRTIVVRSKDAILVEAEHEGEETRLAPGDIVLVQWATGRHVARWREALDSLAAR